MSDPAPRETEAEGTIRRITFHEELTGLEEALQREGALVERGQRSPQRAEDQVALALQCGFEGRELPVELVPHPKRPVT